MTAVAPVTGTFAIPDNAVWNQGNFYTTYDSWLNNFEITITGGVSTGTTTINFIGVARAGIGGSYYLDMRFTGSPLRGDIIHSLMPVSLHYGTSVTPDEHINTRDFTSASLTDRTLRISGGDTHISVNLAAHTYFNGFTLRTVGYEDAPAVTASGVGLTGALAAYTTPVTPRGSISAVPDIAEHDYVWRTRERKAMERGMLTAFSGVLYEDVSGTLRSYNFDRYENGDVVRTMPITSIVSQFWAKSINMQNLSPSEVPDAFPDYIMNGDHGTPAKIRRFFLQCVGEPGARGNPVIYLYIDSITANGAWFDDTRRDLIDAWENDQRALKLSIPGHEVVLPGPNHLGNPSRDSSETYSWSVSASAYADAVCDFVDAVTALTAPRNIEITFLDTETIPAQVGKKRILYCGNGKMMAVGVNDSHDRALVIGMRPGLPLELSGVGAGVSSEGGALRIVDDTLTFETPKQRAPALWAINQFVGRAAHNNCWEV